MNKKPIPEKKVSLSPLVPVNRFLITMNSSTKDACKFGECVHFTVQHPLKQA